MVGLPVEQIRRLTRLGLCPLALAACNTAGSDWMNQPLPGARDPWSQNHDPAAVSRPAGSPVPKHESTGAASEPEHTLAGVRGEGRVLGEFRNTYYDFPSEGDFTGKAVPLMDQSCAPIKNVPLTFHDALCVQGSGNLKSGVTVSFAKRDCECARTCPRTGQKICFEALNPEQFPWGRGALGKAITPLLTVAVDDQVVAMRTVLYIPQFDGLPREPGQSELHDGCFVAQDRGLKVKGQHVDVFTGRQSVTKLWNQLVPSNAGVTVMVDSPRCARLQGTAG